jgi:tRNA-splicing ligase RtcB
MPGASSENLKIVKREYANARKSLGTLGGGNHFIEIQEGSDGHIWVMVHSGSRNLGKQVADHYNRLAIEINEEYFSGVPKSWQLAFLPLNTEASKDYIKEMNYCIDFALANRRLMMDRIIEIFYTQLELDEDHGEIINKCHNIAKMENHFSSNVIVHRKGATEARSGQIGIIPGSQGTSSYIVKGKGNPESFMSCSHGAGRDMGRSQARKELERDVE